MPILLVKDRLSLGALALIPETYRDRFHATSSVMGRLWKIRQWWSTVVMSRVLNATRGRAVMIDADLNSMPGIVRSTDHYDSWLLALEPTFAHDLKQKLKVMVRRPPRHDLLHGAAARRPIRIHF